MAAAESEKEKSGFIERYSDPSDLTTKQILREVAWLEKFFAAEIKSLKEGIEVAHNDLVRVPTDVQELVGSLKELMASKFDLLNKQITATDKLNEEKFKNIDAKLVIGEQARIEQKNDTEKAVDKAFGAAKEAVKEQNTANNIAITKNETSTSKQIELQADLIRQITKGFDERNNDLKDRMTKLESVAASIAGMKEQLSLLNSGASEGRGKSAGYAQFIGWILAAIAIAGFIITNIK